MRFQEMPLARAEVTAFSDLMFPIGIPPPAGHSCLVEFEDPAPHVTACAARRRLF